MENYMQWHIVTSAEYKAGAKNENDLYFLSDTFEIYRGSVSFTRAVGLYTNTLPADPAIDRLYFNTVNLEGKIYDGSEWKTVVRPVVDTVAEDGSNPVSGAAVAAYVTSKIEAGLSTVSVIKDVTYDGGTKKVTVTKGDDSTSSFTLTGLGCSLTSSSSGSKNSIQLVDVDGTPIGDPVEMDVDRFITGAEYDNTGKNIVLYFDGKTGDESTDKIVIPVGDLVDTYTVEGTNTVDLQMVSNKITAAVKISADLGNALEARADGLYVPTVDTSDLIPAVQGAVAGNIPVLDENGMLVDSGKSFEEAGKPTVFMGTTTIEAAVGEATPREGDFCIIKKTISGDITESTAYMYHNSAWVALSGNYDASNVYFAKDLRATANIGVIKIDSSGSATIPAAGKNLVEVMSRIMEEEKNPTATQPSVTVSSPSAATYEVGTKITPSYSAVLNPGSYTYGPATGIVAKTWAISDTAGNSATTASGEFPELEIADGTNYRVTAVATYDESSAVPVTNLGNEYPAVKIAAGSKTGYSGYIKGYRSFFYGSMTDKSGSIDSAFVRALATKSTKAAAKGTSFNIPVVEGAMRVVFAYPQSIDDSGLTVKDANGMDANITTAFTCYTVNVEGANGFTSIPYKVYVSDKAEGVAANTYKVTI